MSNEDGFDRMARAAIRAHRLMALHGTPMMQHLSRLLLLEIGREIAAKREAGAANDNPEASDDAADD
jgi:bacterioferritin (cytochrome b1)